MNNKVNLFRKSCLALSLSLFGVGASMQANAAVFQYSSGQDIVGEVQQTTTVYRDSFVNLTQKYGVSYYELSEANPKIDPWVPGRGARLVVPTRFILPHGKREGIVVNLAELRLYYFPANSNLVYTYPVGIGRTGWVTPVGTTRVSDKVVNPSWRPPEAIRQEQAALGRALPEVVPAGPQNPLGTRAMRLALNGSYLIHGTNNPAGVGRRTSHGCIRMYEQDVAELFSMVPVGTSVRIVHEPYKAGWLNGQLYVEAHKPLADSDYSRDFSLASLRDMISAQAGSTQGNINWNAVKDVFAKADGIPTVVTGSSKGNRVANGGNSGRTRSRQTSW
jgi:L,D-transpeptidase ErfK/SrfK